MRSSLYPTEATAEFSVAGWYCVSSASEYVPTKADGVMVLLSPEVPTNTVRWKEHKQGRLLETRFDWHGARATVLAVYQHVWSPAKTVQANKQDRAAVLKALSRCVRKVPTRDTLVVAGDFNSSVSTTPRLVGPRTLTPQEVSSPHTFEQGDSRTEIDFLLTKALQQAVRQGMTPPEWDALLSKVDAAITAGDQFVAYKDSKGYLLSPTGELQELRKYATDVFGKYPRLQDNFIVLPTLEATSLAKHIASIKPGKAVPKGAAPAASWKICAQPIADALVSYCNSLPSEENLDDGLLIADLCLIPKPGKPADKPTQLRPLGILRPDAKGLAGTAREMLAPHVLPFMQPLPQFAYLPGRGLSDAQSRVVQHLREVRQIGRSAKPSREERKRGLGPPSLVGGITFALDLSQAFDTVSRQDILDQLQALSVEPGLVSLVHALHHSSKYRLHAQGGYTEVETTTGIKQGCKLAPTLFSVLTGRLLHMLIDTFGLEAVQQHLTGYADDISVHKTIRSRRDLQLAHDLIQALLVAVGRLRLRVNSTKCSVMVRLSGTEAPSVMRRHTCWLPDASGVLQKHWRIGANKAYPAFRLEGQIKYLGIIISYSNFELLTLRHRLAEAGKKIQQDCLRLVSLLNQHVFFEAVLPSSANAPDQSKQQPLTTDVTLHSHILIDLDRILQEVQAIPVPTQASQTPAYNCHICQASFDTEHGLRMHTAKMHRDSLSRFIPPLFDRELHAKDGMPVCAACGRSFKQWKGLRDHLLSGACPAPDALRSITSSGTLSNSSAEMLQLQELRREVQGSSRSQLAKQAALPSAQILQHRCVVCGFWTPDHTKVKSHIRQAHPQVWKETGEAAGLLVLATDTPPLYDSGTWSGTAFNRGDSAPQAEGAAPAGVGDLQAVQWQGRTDGQVEAADIGESPLLLPQYKVRAGVFHIGAEVTSGDDAVRPSPASASDAKRVREGSPQLRLPKERGALGRDSGGSGDRQSAPRAAPGRRITALSPEELTQGFLLHEEQLALLQHQVSIVFKFPEDAPMARSLMKAVREWQAEHKAGTAHPWGSCAHYTAAALLKELAKIEDPPKNFSTADIRHLQKVVKELGPDPHESLVHMVSYCSARLSAKKEHVILDFRPVLNTALARQSELISSLLDGCEGERLGKRAPGALVRKARGRPSDR
ncbi:LINE-1 retrotransposable element ORF2 protein [Symbiodinium microadriaticum]|uniref:LINE-1 retrotransposable element ORF2 protein n=1 Tax=Symbiodinium microadriaticum TaxID=2951 RepID=A0A1Q9CYS8_SYMMI|nr:LINE-1 retrotransposable element ORF2 protein [Symbiodinium microadriaticum]